MAAVPSRQEPGARGFDPAASFRAVGLNLVVNALFPYLLYRYLVPRFPADSVLPLLYAMVFPIAGFLFGIVRKRTLDAIALIVLFGLTYHVAVTAASPNIGTALVVRSLQGGLVGLFFLASVAIGRPVVLYIARQFVLAGAPERRARFDAAMAEDRNRTFVIVTLVWGVGLVAMSAVHVTLAFRLAHALFVLVSPILGIVTDLLMLAWTMRFTMRRLSTHLQPPALGGEG
jgi:hypothetical protein